MASRTPACVANAGVGKGAEVCAYNLSQIIFQPLKHNCIVCHPSLTKAFLCLPKILPKRILKNYDLPQIMKDS